MTTVASTFTIWSNRNVPQGGGNNVLLNAAGTGQNDVHQRWSSADARFVLPQFARSIVLRSRIYTTSLGYYGDWITQFQRTPTIALNTADANNFGSDTTPTLEFTGSDADGDDVNYQVQIDATGAFSLGGSIDSYSESNANSTMFLDSHATNNGAIGQTFTSPGGILGSAKFYVQKIGSPTGNVVAKLYAITGTFGTNAVPTGVALATSDIIHASTIPPSQTLVEWVFTGANQYSMSAGNYAIALEYSDGGVSDRLEVATDVSPTHAGNHVLYAFGSWSGGASVDVIFYVISASSIILDKVSTSNLGFLNTVSGGDLDPFTQGNKVSFTVQSGDALTTGTFYWRARAKDPLGSNSWGDWPTVRTFTVTATTTSASDGNASGVGTPTGVGGATKKSDGATAGVGAATGAGTVIWQGVGSAAGVGAATADGQAVTVNIVAVDGSASGVGAASGAGAVVLGGVGRSPDDSPSSVAGLKMWLKADSLALSDGGAIVTWADQSGSGNNAVQDGGAATPIYKTSIVNGLPVVRFNGTSQYLVSTAAVGVFNNVAGGTLFAVFSDTGGAASVHEAIFFSNGTAGGSSRAALSSKDTTSRFNARGRRLDADTAVNSIATFASGFHVVDGVYDWATAGTVTLYVDGTASSSVAFSSGAGNTSATNSLKVGIGFDPGINLFQGDIAEVFVYNVALSTADRQTVERYLATKYGITVSTPPSVSAVQGFSATILVSVGSSVGVGAVTANSSRIAGVVVASSGVASALGVGSSTWSSVGGATGVGTALANASTIQSLVGSAVGVGTVTGASVVVRATVANATGVGTASAVGEDAHVGLVVSADGSAVGTSVVSGVGSAIWQSTISAVGVGAATANSTTIRSVVGSAAGVGAASATGSVVLSSVWSASGTGVAIGVSSQFVSSVFSSTGVGVVTGVGTRVALSVFSATGVGVATGNSVAFVLSVATTSGVSAVNGVAAKLSISIWNSVGVSNVVGIGTDSAATGSDGSTIGFSVVTGISAARVTIVGSSVGVGTANGNTTAIISRAVIAAGVGTADGNSAKVLSGAVTATGVGAVNGLSVVVSASVYVSAGGAIVGGVSEATTVGGSDASAVGVGTVVANSTWLLGLIGLIEGLASLDGQSSAIWQVNANSAGVSVVSGFIEDATFPAFEYIIDLQVGGNPTQSGFNVERAHSGFAYEKSTSGFAVEHTESGFEREKSESGLVYPSL